MSVINHWDGLSDAREVLQSLLAQTSDLTPLMQEIAAYGVSSTQTRIADEKRSPDGEKWASYKTPQYAVSKSKHSSGGLLEYSGMLLKSITSNANADYAEWGSNLAYAARQHHGGDGIESRKYLGLSKQNGDVIKDLVESYYDKH